jgi:hypothetical protein
MATSLIHDFGPGKIPFCQICNSKRLVPFLDLGYQPLANSFYNKDKLKYESLKLFPINVVRCLDCSLVQLDYIVNQKNVYHKEYPYIPSITGVVSSQQNEFANTCFNYLKLGKNNLVVDVGSNDGNLLYYFKKLKCKTIGVEPTNTYKIANSLGIKTYKGFFNEKIAKKIKAQHGYTKLITATNVFAHMSSLGEVMRGIIKLMDKKSYFVFENHYLDNVISSLQYDTFYHEHLRTYTLHSLSKLFQTYNLCLFDAYRVPRYGGSIRCFVSNQKISMTKNLKNLIKDEKSKIFLDEYYSKFRSKVINSKYKLQEKINSICDRGQLVVGKACPARAIVLLAYNNINYQQLPYIAEQSTSLKIGLTIPYLNIPIKKSKQLLKDRPEYVLLLAWHLKKNIIKKWRDLGLKSKFIVPLPKVEIL